MNYFPALLPFKSHKNVIRPVETEAIQDYPVLHIQVREDLSKLSQ